MDKLLEKMEAYADVAVTVGVNLQPGQNLYIEADVDAVEFVRIVAKKAYEAGARNVHVRYTDGELRKLRLESAPEEALTDFPRWDVDWFQSILDEDAARLVLLTVNPYLLGNINPARLAMSNRTSAQALNFFARKVAEVTWTGMAVPSQTWAALLFPDEPETERLMKLWDTVLTICRANGSNPAADWETHMQELKYRAEYLNRKAYHKLHYRSDGTDLTIEFHPTHRWSNAGDIKSHGVPSVPNIPTEEVFTAPLKTGVNGVVKSTKPLNYNGITIENFSFTFENGRITGFEAEQGYDVLKSIVETDEGSHFLGEVALVPHNSPISQSNMLFLNTLYDENAACHLAIGMAIPSSIHAGTQMSQEQLAEHGCNYSLTHVDFMIGSHDLDIDGITAEGVIEPVFRNGNWAF